VLKFLEELLTPQLMENLIMLGRILLSAVCGFIIGMERKNRGKGAGVRTHIIVAMASALMMIISKYGFSDMMLTGDARFDGSRIASQIVTGVGFLGAGMIFVKGHAIQGLTTAAGVWATAGIGMAVGAGMYFIGIATSVAIFLIQLILHRNWKFLRRENEQFLEFVLMNTPESIEKLNAILEELNIIVHDMSYKRLDNDRILVTVTTNLPTNFDYMSLLKHQSELIESVSI
jgi:putative Mg2+ transporter-C (MgtC) family protein